MTDESRMSMASEHRKMISLEVTYTRGRQDLERGVFEGGVPEPEFLEELSLTAVPDVGYREETDGFGPTGKTQIHLRGTRRAYLELARYLLALTELDTLDPDYHDHFDEVVDCSGGPVVHLIVHAPPPDPAAE